MSGPSAIVSVEEMRALESAAVATGTPELELQERAGRVVADVVRTRLADLVEQRGAPGGAGTGGRVVALVGAGNNGRDAAVAARHLAAGGHSVALWLWTRHGLSDGELAQLGGMGVEVRPLGTDRSTIDGDYRKLRKPLDDLRAALDAADVVVDGLLGVGSRGPMRFDLAGVAAVVNEARASGPTLYVVAVDVPSGLDADTGAAPGTVVRADETVTFGAIKAGLLRFPGAELVGRVTVRPIGLPDEAVERQAVRVLDPAAVAPLVPRRPLDSHKYRFGRLLVVAGSDQYVGAAGLGSAAAARAGCGLVGLVSTEAVKQVLAVRLPEATYPATLRDVEGDPEGAARTTAELLPDQQALLIGPGLGRAETTDRFLRALLRANAASERPTPTVIDADALSLLGGWASWWEQIGPGNVVTPHAGEMARLIGETGLDHDAAPWDLARHWAEHWQQVVVLKGPFTTVAGPDGRAWVWPRANPALATGGTGDVLAGLTAGLLAQGLEPFDAARLGVVVHALAGEAVVQERGWRTLLASDLVDLIPRVLAELADQTASGPRTGTRAR